MLQVKKELSQDIILALDWTKAEHRYVTELKQELAELNSDPNIEREEKEIAKANLILKYILGADERISYITKHVEKDLPKVYKALEKELGSGYRVDESALINLKEEAERLKIDNHKLSEYFDFYKTTIKAGIKKEKIEEEFLKTHEEGSEEFHEFHNSILKLTKIVEEKSEGFDRWLVDLSRTLKKAEGSVEQFSTEEKTHINTKGKELLEKYNFDVNRYKELGKILANHPADLYKIAKASGNATYLFNHGILAIKDLINEKTLPDIVKMAEASGKNAGHLFQTGLPAIKDLITEENWPDIVKMAEASGKNAGYLFEYSLPAIKDLINEKTWPDIVKMVETSGINVCYLFQTGLPEIKDLINEKTWPMFVECLPKMAKYSGKNAYIIFKYVLPVIKDLINEKTWPMFVEDLPKMAKASGKNAGYLFEYSLPEIKDLINEKTWPMFVEGLPKMVKASGKNVWELFHYGLPIIKDLITEENWEHYLKFFLYAGRSKQRTTKLTNLSKIIQPHEKQLLSYLIINTPTTALDTISKSELLSILDVNFEHEMNMFMKIALPMFIKENPASQRTMLTPLSKLKETNAKAYNEYLEILNKSLITFQDAKYNFLKVLEASGFKNVEEYSFAELGYIYLRYAGKPNLKLKKLTKGLNKLRKEKAKLLNALRQEDSTLINHFTKEISKRFYEPAIGLYKNTANSKIKINLEKKFKIKIKDLDRKIEDTDLLNALRFYGKSQNIKPLIQNYLQNKTYPLTKNILESYPYNLPQNREWIKKNLKNDVWLKEFERDFRLITEDLKDTNFKDRIKHHLEIAERIIKTLKLSIKRIDLPTLEKVYTLIKKEKKYDPNLLGELNNEIQALKSLEGQEERLNKKLREKVIITQELNPMSALQMGNHIGGSCLNINGANYWSALVNATEVNKRVLWAKEADGTIIARVLIAVDANKRIVRFPTYYATNVPLDRFFNEYIKELAKKCGFGINGNSSKVEHLGSEEWYLDPEVSI